MSITETTAADLTSADELSAADVLSVADGARADSTSTDGGHRAGVPTVIVRESIDDAAEYGAALIEEVVRAAAGAAGAAGAPGSAGAVLGVATGSSPQPLYRAIGRRVAAGLDLSGVRAFALDEYVGIDRAHPESYHSIIRRDVIEPLGMSADLVRVPDGQAASPEVAAAEYDEAIAAAGGIDVQILGIGSNGHIGFNEPGSSPESRTRVVELAESTLLDNRRFFGGDVSLVPTHAVTQGLGTILAARSLVLVASGAGKAAAVAAALEGPVTPECPASFLQTHPSVLFLLDEAAASLLRARP